MFNFWKHKKKPAVIKQECYDKLPKNQQTFFHQIHDVVTHQVVQDDSGNFLMSVLVGEITDSAALGGAIGGNYIGGMIGESIADSQHESYSAPDNNNHSSSSSDSGFSSSDSGGSSGDW